MKISKEQTILVLAPHTDDAEFGCGATISKLIEQGNKVHQIAFSTASQTRDHGTRNMVLASEVKESSKILGIDRKDLYIHDFPVREFGYNRQQILDLMLYYRDKIKPDIIFTPCSDDIHQDHQTINQETLRAFKHETILGYELPWNLYKFDYDLYCHTTIEHMRVKLHAIGKYKSQMHRPYSDPDYIMALARGHGIKANTDYAEAFECIRINFV